MSPIPQEFPPLPARDTQQYMGRYNDEWATLELARQLKQTPNLIKVSQEGDFSIPLGSPNEFRQSVKPLVIVSADTRLLQQIGRQPVYQLGEKQYLYDYYGIRLNFDRKQHIVTVSNENEQIKIYVGSTPFYTGDYEPMSGSLNATAGKVDLIVGGLLVCPEEVFPFAKKGLIVGSGRHSAETMMAITGNQFKEVGIAAPGYLGEFADDLLYPITFPSDSEVKTPLIERLFGRELVGIKTRPTSITVLEVQDGKIVGTGEIRFPHSS